MQLIAQPNLAGRNHPSGRSRVEKSHYAGRRQDVADNANCALQAASASHLLTAGLGLRATVSSRAGPGNFRQFIETVRAGSISIARVETCEAKIAVSLSGRQLIVVPGEDALAGMAVRIERRPFASRGMRQDTMDGIVHVECSQGTLWLISVDRGVLRRTMVDMLASGLISGAEAQAIDPESIVAGTALGNSVMKGAEFLLASRDAIDPVMEGIFLRAIVRCFASTGSTACGTRRTELESNTSLQALCGKIAENIEGISTLREISVLGGLPPRTLQYRFQRYLGCTPIQWLIKRKLIATRVELLQAEKGTRVSDIAFRYFNNLGDFAKRYKAEFGELPSHTLRSKWDR